MAEYFDKGIEKTIVYCCEPSTILYEVFSFYYKCTFIEDLCNISGFDKRKKYIISELQKYFNPLYIFVALSMAIEVF